MAIKHIPPGQDFDHSQSFGFTRSAQAQPAPRGLRTPMPVAKARGGKVQRKADGGIIMQQQGGNPVMQMPPMQPGMASPYRGVSPLVSPGMPASGTGPGITPTSGPGITTASGTGIRPTSGPTPTPMSAPPTIRNPSTGGGALAADWNPDAHLGMNPVAGAWSPGAAGASMMRKGGKVEKKAGGGFIKGAIKRPGREKARAKANDVSVHQQMETDSHSKNPSLRAAGALGLRLTGGDLSPRKKRG